MSGVRKLYLDHSIGESRGVVTLDGKPERLLIERDDDEACQKAGARSVARVARLERGLATAFLKMPAGPDAVAPLGVLVEGAAVEIEVIAEARTGKGAVARVLGAAEGAPRLLAEAPPLETRLGQYAEIPIVEGPRAREAADEAQAAALETGHRLPGGGSLAIETTRALTAVDIDQGERGGGDARRAARQTNLAAIAAAARLLRLKGLGGLVVMDLVGKGHDGPAMAAAAKAAFAPDGPQVAIGPISRFGLFELSLPRTVRPVLEVLTDADGRASLRTAALDLIRVVEREWRANPGAGISVSGSAALIAESEPYLEALRARFGVACTLTPAPGPERRYDVIAR